MSHVQPSKDKPLSLREILHRQRMFIQSSRVLICIISLPCDHLLLPKADQILHNQGLVYEMDKSRRQGCSSVQS